MRTLRAVGGAMVAAGLLFAGTAVVPAQANAAVTAPTVNKKALNKKSSRPFFKDCKRNKRFSYERRYNFGVNPVLAGRCATSRFKGVDLVSTYSGHHPSATKALDVMVNMRGSCSAGRQTGNKVARHFMNNARKYGVRYLIWKNSYWSSDTKPRKWKNWRHGMSGGSCTTRHYDHVHVAFR